jgi:CRISPR/Cas system-associated protein Cas5 (RAMP superfamily)
MTFSLDAEFDEDGESTLLDTIVDEDAEAARENQEGAEAAYALVQSCIDKKKLIEAIILDTIAFNETERVKKETTYTFDEDGKKHKYTKTYTEFWPFKAVQILSKLPTSYADYFGNTYNVNPAELDKALESVRAATNQKLYKYLDRTLADAKTVFTY